MSLADQIIEHGPYKPGDLSPVAYGVDCDALNRLRDELLAARRATTYEEWRVTGQPAPSRGVTYPPYSFTWSQQRGDDNPEQAARRFVAGILSTAFEDWTDGPHLHKRTVTVTEWIEVDA